MFRWGLIRGRMGMQSHMFSGNQRAIDVAVLDVNRDGKLDVVGQGWDNGATIFFGDGSGSFNRHVELATPASGFNDVKAADFNSYGARRGHHDVMVRGTFGNIRLRNQLVPGSEGTWPAHLPDGEETTIYEAVKAVMPAATGEVTVGRMAAGVEKVSDLASRDPEELSERLSRIAAAQRERAPRPEYVRVWVRAAKLDGRPRR